MSSECLMMAIDEPTLTGDLRLALMAIGDCSGSVHTASIVRWCNLSDESLATDLISELWNLGFLSLVDGRLVNVPMFEVESGRYDPVASKKTIPRKRRMVFDSCGWKCFYCGSENDLTIDHKIPRSRGGGDEVENLTCACRSCNSSKGAKTVSEFMHYLAKRSA